MLIIDNNANYSRMPSFGNIAHAKNLMFALRANNPINLVDVLPQRHKLTNNGVTFGEGVIGGDNRYVATDFNIDTLNDLTIRAVAKAVNIAGASKKTWVCGDMSSNGGLGIMITSIPNGSNFDVEVRFYVSALTSSGERTIRATRKVVISNQTGKDTSFLHIWARLNTTTKRLHLRVDGVDVTPYGFSSDDYNNRNGGLLKIADTDLYVSECETEVKELLVWNKFLSDGEMAEQDGLSDLFFAH